MCDPISKNKTKKKQREKWILYFFLFVFKGKTYFVAFFLHIMVPREIPRPEALGQEGGAYKLLPLLPGERRTRSGGNRTQREDWQEKPRRSEGTQVAGSLGTGSWAEFSLCSDVQLT